MSIWKLVTKKMREPLDVGTEEQKTLEDWFDRNEYVPIDDGEDIVKDELEHEVDIVTNIGDN